MINRCNTCKWYQSLPSLPPDFPGPMSYDGYCRLFPVIPEITTKEDGYCGQHKFRSVWEALKAFVRKVWG